MRELPSAIPDADVVLALPVEELAGKVLFLLKERARGRQDNQGQIHFANLILELEQYNPGQQAAYGQKLKLVSQAVTEALAWLQSQTLLVPVPGAVSGGWMILSRRAEAMQTHEDFAKYRTASLLPREILHPSIAERVWLSFVRGDYDTAAFQAMREVEIAVRAASGIEDELGVRLMRQAFRPRQPSGEIGPLTDPDVEPGEQEGMMHLFSGAVAALKNPHSHRTVNFASPAEAVAIVAFASQLLRIVQNRWLA